MDRKNRFDGTLICRRAARRNQINYKLKSISHGRKSPRFDQTLHQGAPVSTISRKTRVRSRRKAETLRVPGENSQDPGNAHRCGSRKAAAGAGQEAQEEGPVTGEEHYRTLSRRKNVDIPEALELLQLYMRDYGLDGWKAQIYKHIPAIQAGRASRR